jgi:type II secretory pathway pseudopilin PulG
MVVVVLIVGIMAAVALPNISQYLRNYKVKGAAQEVAGVLQAARSRAIMSNTNEGVSFVILDADTFRFVQEDMPATDPERLSGVRQLPSGVFFTATALASPGATLRFLRLGGFCNPAASGTACDPPVPVSERSTSGESRLIDTSTADGNFIGADSIGNMVIRVREVATGLERTVTIAPGGRVLPQP